MATGPHISFSAEKLFEIGGFAFTNSIVTSLIVSAIVVAGAILIRASLESNNRPKGLQNFLEFLIETLYELVYSVTASHTKAKQIFPVVASFFFFILINNWVGLLPGVGTIRLVENESASEQSWLPSFQLQVLASEPTTSTQAETTTTTDSHSEETQTTTEAAQAESNTEHAGPKYIPLFRPATADLNTTFALAIVAMLSVQFFGISYLKLGYFKKFINFSSPMNFFVGILETVSEFSKVVSFSFRLFGNVFAGEVLLSVLSFIGGSFLFFIPMPFYGLEIFVGLVQALVFLMLSLVLINMATISHDGEH